MDDHQDGNASLREVMGSYPTGVTIVAAQDDDGAPYGLTVNSFTSVSLDPPLVLVCVGHSSTSHDRLVAGDHFSVNILAPDQATVASRFATNPSVGRFDDVDWVSGPSGCPFIEGAAALIECSVEEVLRGGDHSILIGRVGHARLSDQPALIFHRGRFSSTDG
jgi:flavin-dependent trigonelline monooxygenase, reductase component